MKKDKRCPQCEKFRNRKNFYGHPNKKDGKQPVCKFCQKINTARYQAEDRKKDPQCPWGLQGQSLDSLVQKQIQRIQDWRE